MAQTATILNRLYASSGEEVIIETLQINIGSEVCYLRKGLDDITATTENGDTVTFLVVAIDIALPVRSSGGTRGLQLAIGSIDGVISTAIRNALDNLPEVLLTYHNYIPTDPSVSVSIPYTPAIKSSLWTSTRARITTGYMNILDTMWPRHHCTPPYYPGLRYMS